MNEAEATAEILDAISRQLALVTSKFCLLSSVYGTLIREGKLDPFDFIAAIQSCDSPEFRSQFAIDSPINSELSSKLIH